MKQMTVRIDDETYDKLAWTGQNLGIGTATVARIWLKQRSDELPKVPRSSRPEARTTPTKQPPGKNPQGTRAERRAQQRKKG